MRNLAKCKICNSVIESFHAMDYVTCKCGEISVDGGEALKCAARNWSNFMRVDDKGNAIVVKMATEVDVKPLDIQTLPTKKELVEMLDEMIKSFERLPEHAMLTPISHYDFCSALLLLSSIFKSELGSERNNLS